VKTHLRAFEQVQVRLRGKIQPFPGSELQSRHENSGHVGKVESMHDAVGGMYDVGQSHRCDALRFDGVVVLPYRIDHLVGEIPVRCDLASDLAVPDTRLGALGFELGTIAILRKRDCAGQLVRIVRRQRELTDVMEQAGGKCQGLRRTQ